MLTKEQQTANRVTNILSIKNWFASLLCQTSLKKCQIILYSRKLTVWIDWRNHPNNSKSTVIGMSKSNFSSLTETFWTTQDDPASWKWKADWLFQQALTPTLVWSPQVRPDYRNSRASERFDPSLLTRSAVTGCEAVLTDCKALLTHPCNHLSACHAVSKWVLALKETCKNHYGFSLKISYWWGFNLYFNSLLIKKKEFYFKREFSVYKHEVWSLLLYFYFWHLFAKRRHVTCSSEKMWLVSGAYCGRLDMICLHQ